MAHTTDVNQVPRNFEIIRADENVTDPVCGKTMRRKDSRCVVFRGTDEHHFCSRQCRDSFLKRPSSEREQPASAEPAASRKRAA